MLVSTFLAADVRSSAHASLSKKEFTHIDWEGQGRASFSHSCLQASVHLLALFSSRGCVIPNMAQKMATESSKPHKFGNCSGKRQSFPKSLVKKILERILIGFFWTI